MRTKEKEAQVTTRCRKAATRMGRVVPGEPGNEQDEERMPERFDGALAE